MGLALSGGCTRGNPAFRLRGTDAGRAADGNVGSGGSDSGLNPEAAGPADATGEAAAPPDAALDRQPASAPSLLVGDAGPLDWHGGEGGTLQPADRCPPGQVAIGHQGAVSDESTFVARVQILCGSLRVTSTAPPYPVEVTREAFLPARGKTTGQDWTALCPDGEVVVGYSGQAGQFLESLRTHCAPLEVTADRTAVRIGVARDLPAHGSGDAPAFQDHCHRLGQVLVGAETRTGGWLDAIRPHCATITVVSAAAL